MIINHFVFFNLNAAKHIGLTMRRTGSRADKIIR
jgi:hypothetical protein